MVQEMTRKIKLNISMKILKFRGVFAILFHS